jgi:hypothetical protein
MHMVLLGLDLLRMHNNKAVFAQYQQHQAGFFEILRPSNGAAARAAAAGGSLTITTAYDGSVAGEFFERRPPGALAYPELYNLSEEDLHSVAGILATVLLMERLQMQCPTENARPVPKQKVRISLVAGGAPLMCVVRRARTAW